MGRLCSGAMGQGGSVAVEEDERDVMIQCDVNLWMGGRTLDNLE